MRNRMAGIMILAALGLASQAHADNGYVKITGAKQGEIKSGLIAPKLWANQSEVVALEWGVSQPATAAVAIGRRTHEPLTLTLRWTKAAPQLLQAAQTNEVLSTVVYSDAVPSPEGVEQVRHTLTLSNARILSIKIIDRNGTDYGVEPLVVVSLAYQKLVMTEVDGGVTAEDDWTQAP